MIHRLRRHWCTVWSCLLVPVAAGAAVLPEADRTAASVRQPGKGWRISGCVVRADSRKSSD